jgi:phage terminase large subunit
VKVTISYRPRPYQAIFEQAMLAGKRRAFLLYHRRAGKDIACWNFLINCALEDRPGLYFYVLPTYTQGKRVIWDGIDESGTKLLHFIPKDLIVGKPNSTEMKLNLINGSMIQIVGAENYDALRGTNPKGVVFSEYAMQDPRAWTEVISPILAKNDGWAVFNTTPLGKNHAFDLWQMAERSENWFTQKLTVDDTNLIPRSVIDTEILEGKPEEIIQQEYWCSFDRGVDGTYYGRLISKAWDDGRICSVPYDPSLDVDTSWDLGVGDSTAIWFFQQTPGGEVHFIDFYENTGEGLAHYVSVLREKDYLYGKHYLPHDVKARELGTGASREEMLRKLRVKPTIVPKLSIDDGIQAVRSILPRSWFDKTKCATGINHLENYRKAYSNKLRSYLDRPLHDDASNASDSLRYCSLAIAKGAKSGMTEADAENMAARYGYNI